MVSTSTCWTLIIVGIVLVIIGGVIAYGGFPAIPYALWVVAVIAFWIGVILLILGAVLLIVYYIRAKTGT